jgi:hypothetical protein
MHRGESFAPPAKGGMSSVESMDNDLRGEDLRWRTLRWIDKIGYYNCGINRNHIRKIYTFICNSV